MNAGQSGGAGAEPGNVLAGADASAERKYARLAAELRWLRRQLTGPDALDNPSVYAELNELFNLVWSAREQRAGRHRLQGQAQYVHAPVRDAAGFDLKPDPLTARTGGDLVARLREYREWAGDPPFRKIAAQARQEVAHSTIYTALKGEGLPSLQVVLAIVAGCGGGEADQQAFATAWRRVKSGRLDASPRSGPTALRIMSSSAAG